MMRAVLGTGKGNLCLPVVPDIDYASTYQPAKALAKVGIPSNIDHGSSGTRVRPRQWNPASRGLVVWFFRGHSAAVGPIQPWQPILILGASWNLPTCQRSAISPGWHYWSVQMPFCRGLCGT